MKERQLLEKDFAELGLGEKGQQIIEDVLDLESCRFEKVETVKCLNCLEEILDKAVKDPDYKDDYNKISRWLLPDSISNSVFSKNSKLEFLEYKINGKRWNFGVRRFF